MDGMKRIGKCGDCRYCREWQGRLICGRVMPITLVETEQPSCYLAEGK